MNKKYPTFFLTWFNKFSRVPYPGCWHLNELIRQYEDKKAAILTYGPPHLRLESWYTPMINAYERQLPIKVFANHTLSSL
jgi:hypothetical protein